MFPDYRKVLVCWTWKDWDNCGMFHTKLRSSTFRPHLSVLLPGAAPHLAARCQPLTPGPLLPPPQRPLGPQGTGAVATL